MVENCGESAITAIPQIIQAAKKSGVANQKIKGEAKQKLPEKAKLIQATFRLPYFCESSPPKMQEMLPTAMMAKVVKANGSVLW
jgi:hypothetical protein